MTRGKWTRRDLLLSGGAALAAPYFVPSHVLGAPGQPGANDKVNVGIIGLGGRARQQVIIFTACPRVSPCILCCSNRIKSTCPFPAAVSRGRL